MDDDEDAFLYGDEPTAVAPEVANPDSAANGTVAAAAPIDSTDSTQAAARKPSADHQDEDEDEDEDGDQEDEDSDSDIEFIIDATQEAQPPPPRSGLPRPGAPGARPLPNQSTPQRPHSTLTSEYTPLSRAQLLANASPAGTTDGSAAQPAGVNSSGLPPPGASPVKPQTPLDGPAPEGGPPPVPSTAPRLDLSPGPEERAYPKPEDAVEEDEVSPRDIFDIDLETLPEKPWRRYGADLTDYFNYGFNEESWSLWRGKKERMTDSRKQAENNMFGGNSGDMMSSMQQMMSMMPPPQAMQAMMQPNGGPGGPGPMGMPPMPPDQMMAMMASMSGMPGMPPMPPMPPMGARGMNPMMMPGMFGGPQSNGAPGPGGNEQPSQQQQQQSRFSNSPFPQGQSQDGQNSPYPPSAPGRSDRLNDQAADQHEPSHDWDTPGSPPPDNQKAKEESIPPGMPAVKTLSDADMSAFFGASGVDLSQVAAAGIQVPHDGNDAPSTTGKKPPPAPSKPGPPRSAPSGPAAAKGTSIRGRAAAAAASTSSRSGRAVSPTLPPNVPSGPKNPGKRYNDRDTGAGAADLLDYGATSGGGGGDEDRGRSDEWDARDHPRDHGSRETSGWESPPGRSSSARMRRGGTHDTASANGRDSNKNDDDGYSSRHGAGRSSKRSAAADEPDDETASQSSAGGRRRRTGGSSRGDHHRERESSSSHRDRDHRSDRDREREKEKEREREARSQARSERRAGRDLDDPAIPTGPSAGVGARGSRKRAAPEDRDGDEDGAAKHSSSSSSRKSGGSRKKR